MDEQTAVRATQPIQLPRRAGAAQASGMWTFDPTRWVLQAPNGCAVQLSPTQAQLVRYLFTCRGGLASRDDLLTALRRPQLDACSRNLDVAVSRLRKKVQQRCRCKLPLMSVHGRGYAFQAPARVLTD